MQLRECDGCVCEVKAVNNNLIATGTVRILPEEEHLLEVQDSGGHLPSLGLDTKVKLVIHLPQRLQVLAARVYISTEKFLRVRDLESYAEYEKRRFFRLAIDHSAILMPPSGMKDKNGKPLPYRLTIRVRDLSLCGLMFVSNREFSVGDEMRITMTMVNNEMEVLNVAIRRQIPWEEPGEWAYGCEILRLSSHGEQRLNAYMLEQQQIQILKSRR